MTLGTILIILLILVVIGALPSWGYSRGWGYGPSGGLGLLLLIVVILALTGRIYSIPVFKWGGLRKQAAPSVFRSREKDRAG